MENKLQKLTEKLYNEGLSKGKQEAEEVLDRAKTDAKKIVDEAQKQADLIVAKAHKEAEDLARNTQTEINLAAKQTVSTIKQQIQNLVVNQQVSPAVKAANQDPDFVKRVIIEVSKNWNPDKAVNLEVLLPQNTQEQFLAQVQAGIKSELEQGVEVKFDQRLKSGFKIGPKNGGFYISFTDEDFDALFREYLRPRVAEMLYGNQKQ